jgi:autotransporter-associated beta strand protein
MAREKNCRPLFALRGWFALGTVLLNVQLATAQLTEFGWTGGANSNWHDAGNWDLAGFPNSGLHSASISVGADLTVDLGASNATVAALALEGTTNGTAIVVGSTGGGMLVLQNNEDNTSFNDPNPEIGPVLTSVGSNDGRVLIASDGVTGTTNEIGAPIRINNSGFLEGVDIIGTRSVTFSGNLDITGDELVNEFATFAQIRSFLPADQNLLITGDISLNDPVTAGSPARSLLLNSYGSTDHGIVDDVPMPDDDRSPPRGTIEITGVISGTGGIGTGWEWSPAGEQAPFDPAPPPGQPLSTVILSGDNTFTGNVAISRGNLVVRHNNALGNGGRVFQAGQSGNSKEVGFNLVADAGDLTITNPLTIVQWQTFMGNSSITWQGMVYQDGARGMINLLPHDLVADTGETLTFTGPMFASREAENPPEPGRIITFDGTGKTVVTGGIHDMLEDDPEMALNRVGSLRKRGTGTLVIDFDESSITDTPTDYRGDTYVQGGNLHFAANNDLPSPGEVAEFPAEMLSSGGAVGVDAGILDAGGVPDNTEFLEMFDNSDNPNVTPPTNPPFFRPIPPNNAILNRYDYGGLMLGGDEYGQNLDFNNATLSRTANMSLAAWETGSTYTGTITPSSSVIVNPDTYQLGGGSGSLTLPGDNQLTGDRDLLVKNGGEVRLDGVNDYTGSTTVLGRVHTSLQENAATGTSDSDNDGDYGEELPAIHIGSTLTVSSLNDGNSSIGTSTAAEDLVVQGSTLRYVGGAVSTNRLLTVGTAGATIDASGSGALNFANSAPLAIDVAEDRLGVLSDSVPTAENNEVFGVPSFSSGGSPVVFDTSDLVPGMAVHDLTGNATDDDDNGVVIVSVPDPHVITMGEVDIDEGGGDNVWPGYSVGTAVRTIGFGPAPARTLTLAGDNPGDNTLGPQITDAADRDEADGGGGPGGKGSVGVTKTGAGRWLLANANNTYTGDTIVEEGTLAGLSIGSGDLTVESGGTIAPGLSTGTLAVGGDYLQAAGGALEVEINGATTGMFDLLEVTGDATLEDGASIDIVLGAAIGTGTTFDILTASSITANIDMLSLTGAAGFEASLADGGTILQLMFTGATGGLAGDYNDDGIVNAADYVVWRNAVASGGSLINEGDNPGTADQGDYTYWKTNFGATAGSGSDVASAVPEPTSVTGMLLAIVGMLGMGSRRC